MDENKKETIEELSETVEENDSNVVEEVDLVAEATENTETVEDEFAEDEEEAEEILDEEDLEEDLEEDSSEAEKYVQVKLLIDQVNALKKKNRILSLIIVAICVVAIAFGGVKLFGELYNPYNHMGYPNYSGLTLGEFAQQQGISVEEFKSMYNLPDDVKENTNFDAVQYIIPVSKMAEMNGVDFATMKEVFQFSDEITPDSTWGEAYDSIKLSVLFGEEELKELKETYGLDESVTLDTTWGEIRRTVDKIEYEKYLTETATDATE